jgi:hypothetical protein
VLALTLARRWLNGNQLTGTIPNFNMPQLYQLFVSSFFRFFAFSLIVLQQRELEPTQWNCTELQHAIARNHVRLVVAAIANSFEIFVWKSFLRHNPSVQHAIAQILRGEFESIHWNCSFFYQHDQSSLSVISTGSFS